MRKQFLFIFLVLIVTNTFQAQTRGTKVGYIDMEYILQNVPDYTEAQNQLEQKAQKWKQEIEVKKTEINKLKDALKAEKALLTKGLIEERTAEIVFLENETLDLQQKRFGPNGDLMTQKASLTKPIQDQVFTAVQDIAEAKKYDFIFDKTSDLTMLFAAKRFDISDQIIRILNRTEKREQLTKKQLKEEEAKEAKEEAIADNPNLSERQKSLDAKKAARDAVIANRILLLEERKKAAEDRKLQITADREAKKTGINPSASKTETTTSNTFNKEAAATAAAEAKQAQANQRAETLRIRQQTVEDKKAALEERRQQILNERAAKKTGIAPATLTTAVPAAEIGTEKEATKTATATAAAEAKQKQIDARAKTLEDRKKVAEENKKVQEEKRKQALAEKEAKKTGTVSENTTKEAAKTQTAKAPVVTEAAKAETDTTVVKEIKTATEEAKQKQADARAKTLEERNKVIEERKKTLEERRKKILEVRETTKKVNEEKLKTKEKTNNN
ncbi:OmpH family outer membrane protein [Flavobacterium soyangense]|uniref:OmpH family outer membrane protein n=1 Tax=Flavobacterium soyangense TaxID=2023265 RepID=A0A930UCK1_9FLAO|nr:OmpH family outer membrane protein [Flavobacterium soyangense]MBF2708821.1 OmpH family outer membrane protein [Flavobacterium soyangense]